MGQEGSALLISMLILFVLTLVGMVAYTTSNTEIQIAANEKLHNITFYEADGGGQVGIELLEENIYQKGFDIESGKCELGDVAVDLDISSERFYLNSGLGTAKADCSNRDAFFPKDNTTCDAPITNLRIGGTPSLSMGGAIQMIAGYEGVGKGVAGGGAWFTYDIRSQNENVQSSEAVVNIRWRHVD